MTFYAGSFPGVVQSYYRLKTNIRVYLGIDKPTKPVGVFFLPCYSTHHLCPKKKRAVLDVSREKW